MSLQVYMLLYAMLVNIFFIVLQSLRAMFIAWKNIAHRGHNIKAMMRVSNNIISFSIHVIISRGAKSKPFMSTVTLLTCSNYILISYLPYNITLLFIQKVFASKHGDGNKLALENMFRSWQRWSRTRLLARMRKQLAVSKLGQDRNTVADTQIDTPRDSRIGEKVNLNFENNRYC